MTKRKRSPIRILGALLLLLVVLVAGGALALRLILTPDRLRAEVREATTEATGLETGLDAATLSFVPFGVSIEGLTIPSDSPEDPPFLRLNRGLLRLELGALLARTVRVRTISLEEPQVFVRQRDGVIVLPGKLGKASPAGGGDSPAPATPPAGTPPPAVLEAIGLSGAIDSFEIADASFRLATPDAAEDVALDGIDLTGSMRIEPGGRRVLSAGELSLAGLDLAVLAAWRETLERVHPVLRYDVVFVPAEGRLLVEELRLVAAPLDLAFRGSVHGLPAQATLELELEPRVYELSEFLPLVPPAALPEGVNPTARGPVRVSARITGPVGDPETPPTVEARLAFEGATFGLADHPLALEDLRGEVRATSRRVDLEDLTATLGGGTLAITGAVDGIDDPESTTFDVDVRADLDLSLVEASGFAPAGVSASGRMIADIEAQGATADPTRTTLGGTARLEGGAFSSPELPAPVEGLTANVVFEGSTVRLAALGGSLGRSSFEGTGIVTDAFSSPHVRLEGHVPMLDLIELAPAADPANGSRAAGDGRAPLGPDEPLVPPLPDVAADLELLVDSLVTPTSAMSGVRLTAILREGRARVEGHIAEADFDGVLMSGFDTGVDVADGTVRGGFRAPRVDAHGIPLTDVSGTVDLDAERHLAITDVTAAVWTGRIAGDARVDMTDLESPAFDIRTEAHELEANDFLTALTPAHDLMHGSMDLTSHFAGKGSLPETIAQSLTGDGQMDVQGGRLARTPAIGALWKALNLEGRETIDFRDLRAAFRVAEGRVITDDLQLGSPEADWRISGFTTFDGTLDYDVQVELSETLSDEYRGRVGRDLAALLAGTSGRLVLDLRVTGPARSPRVNVDLERLAARARDSLQKKLKDDLTGGLKDLLGGGGSGSDSAGADSTGTPAEKPDLKDALKNLFGGRK